MYQAFTAFAIDKFLAHRIINKWLLYWLSEFATALLSDIWFSRIKVTCFNRKKAVKTGTTLIFIKKITDEILVDGIACVALCYKCAGL